MISTFNCGVGFCLIVQKKNMNKIKNFFQININHMKLDIFQKIIKKFLFKNLKW